MKIQNIVRKDFFRLFFIILSFLLMIFVSYYFVSGIVERQIFINVQKTIDVAEANIRSDFRESEIALHYTGLLIAETYDTGGSLEAIESHLQMISSGLASGNSRIPGLLNIYGYFYNNHFVGLEWDPPEDFAPEERNWYKAAVAANGDVGITPPFTDVVTGTTVIALAKTIQGRDGQDLGIIVVEFAFSFLSDYVKALHFGEGGHGILCDGDFTIIAHPFPEYLNLTLDEAHAGYGRLERALRENPRELSAQRVLRRNNRPMIVVFRQIYNGWYLGLATPVASFFREVNSMAITLSVLSLAFIIVLSSILIRLSISKARSEEENMEKSSFLARMSHEIRTPMNSILGMAELIQRKTVSDEIQEYIEIIHQSGNNLLVIINDILDFSKIESDRLQIQNHDYDIASVINDMINMMRPRIVERSLDFFVRVDCGIPFKLYGDDMRLRQILTNLLSNAVKYTRKGYISLDVGMERVDDETLKLVCTVTDSGVGIKDGDKERLFKEFSRLEIETNQGIEGTGLGLVITRALCRAMGGDISFSSEYTVGSVFNATIIQKYTSGIPVAQVMSPETKRVLFFEWRPQYEQALSDTLRSLRVEFTSAPGFREFCYELEHGAYDYAFISSKYAMDCIYIPGLRDDPIQLVVMIEPGELAVYRDVASILIPVTSIGLANMLNNTQGEIFITDKKDFIHFTAPDAKVLIVDDITTNLRVAKELMTPYGMTIHTCLSGSEACDLLKRERYDLVFMDHMMPGMDGVEATGVIRGLPSVDDYFRGLPIVALTANAVSGQREFFLQNGIDDFLAKPIDIKKLDEILERWLPPEKRQATVRIPQPAAVREKAEVLIIPGVEITQGLHNCGGDIGVYFNILGDFCNDADDRLLHIANAFYNDDAKTYTTLVHALKGAALSIGALKIGEQALWLERASESGDLEPLENKTNELLDDIRSLSGTIRNAIKQRDSKESQAPEAISTLRLEVLKTALADMDIEAVNRMLLTFTGLSLDSKTRAAIAEIEQLILMFEYEKAIKKIEEAFGDPLDTRASEQG